MRLTENQLRRIIRNLIKESHSESAINFHRGEMAGTINSCWEEGYAWCRNEEMLEDFDFTDWDEDEILEFTEGYEACEAEGYSEEEDYQSMDDRWENDNGYYQNPHQEAISDFRRGERVYESRRLNEEWDEDAYWREVENGQNRETEYDRRKREEQSDLDFANSTARGKEMEIKKAVQKMMDANIWDDSDAENWLDENGYSEQTEAGHWQMSDIGAKIFHGWEDAKNKWAEEQANWYQQQEDDWEMEEEYGSAEEREAAAERADDIRRYGHDDF